MEPKYELLSKTYVASNEKLKFKCNKGHIYEVSFASFQAGHRCPYCLGKGRRTIEFIKKEIFKYEYECLSDIYSNNQSVLRLRCDKGHIYKTNWANFQSGYRCPECAGTKRLTIEYVKEEILKADYLCLDDEYINNSMKLNIQCDKGHIYQATWGKFRNGKRCPYCVGYYKNINNIKKQTRILAPSYECLSLEYVDSKTKLKFKCAKGHIYYAIWNSFKYGTRCPQCARSRQQTIEEIQEKMLVIAPTYKCLGDKYINAFKKLEFECDKGHRFKTIWGSFYRQGTRCPICSVEKAGDVLRFTIEFIKAEIHRLTNNRYVCLSDEYYNNMTELLVRCDKGHIFKTCWSNFRSGSRCPKCAIIDRTKYSGDEAEELGIYRLCVKRFTDENYRKYYYTINPNRLERSYLEFHVDHIYSVADGFNNNILPKIIASPVNLQMLCAFDNQSKNDRSDITKEELFDKYNKFIGNEGVISND